jgi:hypothetical protein
MLRVCACMCVHVCVEGSTSAAVHAALEGGLNHIARTPAERGHCGWVPGERACRDLAGNLHDTLRTTGLLLQVGEYSGDAA